MKLKIPDIQELFCKKAERTALLLNIESLETVSDPYGSGRIRTAGLLRVKEPS